MYAVYWLIASAVFLLVEIMTLGLTSIWFAGGALAGLLVQVLGGSVKLQLALFAAVSFALLLSLNGIYRGNMSVVCTDKTSCQTIFKQQGAKNEYRCIDRTDSTCQRNDQ